MASPTLRKLFNAQENDHACTQVLLARNLPVSIFNLDIERVLVRIVLLYGASQWYILITLRRRIFNPRHHSLVAAFSGELQMYDNMWQPF